MLKRYHLLCNAKNIAIKRNRLRYHSNNIAIKSKKLSLNANFIVLKSQKLNILWADINRFPYRCNQLIYDFGKPHLIIFISHIDVNMILDFVAFLNWQLTLVLIINNCKTDLDIMIWTNILSWTLNKVLIQPLHTKWIDRSIVIKVL